MDAMENMDLDNEMTVLEGAAVMEEIDEVEGLSNSLKEIIRDEGAKTKLHCLMMDPAFSMVTLQSEDSGILWETASSRCSTPWALELDSTEPELCTSLVPRSHQTSGSETAGKIVFIMDENQVVRRTKRIRDKAVRKLPILSEAGLVEPERPAMVEVSVPNVTMENGSNVQEADDVDEDKNQRLFSLVSEGSEILNIIVPPKISTVDEEESQGLVDNLSYLEETPVVKASELSYEPEASVEDLDWKAGKLESIMPPVPEPFNVPPIIKPARRRTTSEDYFEKFTLLDQQASGSLGASVAEDVQDPESIFEQEDEAEDPGSASKSSLQATLEDFTSPSGLEFTSEHLDEIFYGGGRAPDVQPRSRNGEHKDLPKSPLKKSGSELFGSQESILTPVFLPSGPEKIIDLVLLEEPKAMAFMYSDLYADAMGSRQKQDDTESITSEKSFHSQESDTDDRGYLEKFVLKDEMPPTQPDLVPDCGQLDGVPLWSKDTVGVTHHGKTSTVEAEAPEEITDFFRSSANSSPCDQPSNGEREETRQRSKSNKRVIFQDEAVKQGVESISRDIGVDPSAVGDGKDYKSIIAEFAIKTAASKPNKPEKTKPVKFDQVPFIVPPNVQPITPQHKPFLDLTPLLLVQTPEEVGAKEMEVKAEGVESPDTICPVDRGQEASENSQGYELITKPVGSEFDLCVGSKADHTEKNPLS